MSVPELPQMQADIDQLISNWGKRHLITRASGSLNTAGRFSGTFVAQASGLVWIQPFTGEYKRGDGGILDKVACIAFVSKSLDVRTGDKLLAMEPMTAYDQVLYGEPLTGQSIYFEYDVLDCQDNPTHNLFALRKAKR
jgi:hypothetical protein